MIVANSLLIFIYTQNYTFPLAQLALWPLLQLLETVLADSPVPVVTCKGSFTYYVISRGEGVSKWLRGLAVDYVIKILIFTL